MTPLFIIAGLENALNRYLRLDPEVLPRLAELEGAVIAIEPEGLDLTLYLFPGSKGIQVNNRYEGESTVRIRGALPALIRQWRGQSVGGQITVDGDSIVGRQFQTLLARLDIDWEEQLSTVVGDMLAHRFGTLWHGLRRWSQQTSATLLRDGSEYLQQELRALPPRSAVESFLGAVDLLREDADRLEARMARLRRQLAGGDLT
ncbi:MAG: SCP2 sterol-binding domain-containing protein [Gammaproteobacteria bacterium]|nr:SCP2 sterol-binding domain-containing protein [Gammaproteobacteria bacterium]MCP5198224.1 SCP2 sterol-binding domain-containing protein [Gammaproteobacteria bacterium]